MSNLISFKLLSLCWWFLTCGKTSLLRDEVFQSKSVSLLCIPFRHILSVIYKNLWWSLTFAFLFIYVNMILMENRRRCHSQIKKLCPPLRFKTNILLRFSYSIHLTLFHFPFFAIVPNVLYIPYDRSKGWTFGFKFK